MERTWKYGRMQLFRAEKLYTAKNYQTFLKTFSANFPNYVYFCPFRNKNIISAPISSVKKIYVPKECLRFLTKLKRKDDLQEATLDFIALLSNASGICAQDFGVHGSVALGMHSAKSDIDIVVYGSLNFRKLEKTVDKLVETGTLEYVFNNRLDAARRFKGRFENRIFMYNAIRKPEEVNSKYGEFTFSPVKLVKFHCTVSDDDQAMFRPAIYKIKDYTPIDKASVLPKEQVPRLVVSMIGCYRNVVRQGGKMKVNGMLERVENVENHEVYYQVVVGTGSSEEEHIWPL